MGSSSPILGALQLDREVDTPLYRQLYEGLRSAILGRTLRSGTRLPSSRTLAGEVGISRNTVLRAYEELAVEGYVVTRKGAGTFVSRSIPDDFVRVRPGNPVGNGSGVDSGSTRTVQDELSARGEAVTRLEKSLTRSQYAARPFCPGLPALDAFPIEKWRQITNRRWKSTPPSSLTYGSSIGFEPLREVIAEYLGTARGVTCSPDQILIVSGTQQALSLAARVLLDPGDMVLLEDPGYPRARGAVMAAGATVEAVPVDDEGINLGKRTSADAASMLYVTPSHQYPLGCTMSLERRHDILEWAAREKVWILEDDYDSEYRYGSMPIPALQGLDEAGRVLYIGTFSKVLFPALRLGYLVLPPDLVDPFVAARSMADRCPPLINQLVLTDFMQSGEFERHIRRTRTLYEERQAVFNQMIERKAADVLTLSGEDAGLHSVAYLPPTVHDEEVVSALAAEGYIASPLSRYFIKAACRPALILGYAAFDCKTIDKGVEDMATIIRAIHRQRRYPLN